MPLRLLIFIAVAWLLFTVFVTVFAASANKNEVRNLPKWLWILICLAVPIIGGLLYLVLGRPLGRPKGRGGRTRIVAPDDDPAFLRDLSNRLDDAQAKPESSAEGKPEHKDPNDENPESEPKDKS
jgi:hypothetical protein